jgi:hypothetical protein
MSKTWIVIGVVVILLAGFLWYRGGKQGDMYSSGTYNTPSTATTDTGTTSGTTASPTTVSSTSSVTADLQAADSQMNQLGTDTTNVDASLK